VGRDSFFGAGNLLGQEPFALRGENDGRIRAAEKTLALVNTGAWTPYTPTFYGFTKGNGFLEGWYSKKGRDVSVNVRMQWGTTSAWVDFGYLYVPFAPNNPSYWVGSVYASAAGLHQVGVWRSDGTGTGAGPILFSNGTHINTGNPAAWANGNVMWASVTYEAAS
jgi:hypothetical protein